MKWSPEEQSPWKIPFFMLMFPVEIVLFSVEICNEVCHFFIREEVMKLTSLTGSLWISSDFISGSQFRLQKGFLRVLFRIVEDHIICQGLVNCSLFI